MRYSGSALVLAGGGQTLPSVTLEFFGSANSTIGTSIDPLFRLDIGDVVGQRVGVHRPVVDADLAGFQIEPALRVFHPVLVVAIGEILARMRAAAFGAVDRGVHGDHGLLDQIGEFQRLDQVGIPDQRAVGDVHVGNAVE